ncbi:hypothetical protein MPLSOD_340115 [Mesorhizobium sp. SOD10]|nr:hypothetical protein MPLSOD_340115 [Mesorhizobium sp. SOD10]
MPDALAQHASLHIARGLEQVNQRTVRHVAGIGSCISRLTNVNRSLSGNVSREKLI